MSDQRRERIRLEISREAARLFWRHGVAATSGEQIADAVGLSVRTIWRYFPNKESCAEPIVTQSVHWFMVMLRTWPPERSLEDHFAAERARSVQEFDSVQKADNDLAIQMVALSRTEAAIRSAWLMASDAVENEMATILAARLRHPIDQEIRLHAALATAVVRVIDEDICVALMAGELDHVDVGELAAQVARAVSAATGGAVGDPVED